jgi:hypothetical protein
MFFRSFVELRDFFVCLRVIVNVHFYTKIHEEVTKIHEVTIDIILAFETCSILYVTIL